MTPKKSGSPRRSKHTEDRATTLLNAEAAVRDIKKLIRFMKMSAEQKITLDDSINNLAKESELMMDGIDMASATKDKEKLLAAYKKFLEHNIEVVNQRLRELE
jgi:hypothetical protein